MEPRDGNRAGANVISENKGPIGRNLTNGEASWYARHAVRAKGADTTQTSQRVSTRRNEGRYEFAH